MSLIFDLEKVIKSFGMRKEVNIFGVLFHFVFHLKWHSYYMQLVN